MAVRHVVYSAVIPPNTPQATPVEVLTTFDPGIVDQVQISTPGNVLTGIRVAIAHQVVIPWLGTQWIMSTNASQNFYFTVSDWPESGQWSVFGYNTDTVPHGWQVYFEVQDIPTRYQSPARLVPSVMTPGDVHEAAQAAGLNQPN